jgi:hypothetical protein
MPLGKAPKMKVLFYASDNNLFKEDINITMNNTEIFNSATRSYDYT